ncbi:MAG: helix-turn-helix domain-containing protein [Gammaproteobacteria bacterium]|nr:helix-turn-helix domain-containing protein [Gammaproteobacteria bacterium]
MEIRTLAIQLKERRNKLGLSQEALAKQSKVSRNYISLIESEQIDNVSLAIINKLAVALNATPGQLMGETRDTKFSEVVIDPALAELAEADGLSADEVLALARIEYRGARPKSVREWRDLYNVVKKLASRR